MSQPSILVIGCGSIGERHLRCFLNTGRCRAAVCDTNGRLVAEVAGRYGVPGFESLEAAQEAFPADGWVVCTPAHTHLPLALRGLARGVHQLIEKPLATGLEQVEETRAAIASSGCHAAVAYVFHAMPWLRVMREVILSGELGSPRHATLTAGQHFPTFRPAYREIYYARHESGGGAIQDALTHSVNAMEWLIGPATRVYCDASHQVLEGVSVEDTVNVCARHGDVLAGYGYNQFQAPNELEIRVHCERGSVAMQLHEQRWGMMRLGETEWTWHRHPAPLERDDLFTWQAESFLEGMAGRPCFLATFEEGVRTLKFNLAALESARRGQPVVIS